MLEDNSHHGRKTRQGYDSSGERQIVVLNRIIAVSLLRK